MEEKKQKIGSALVVDDEKSIREIVTRILRKKGFEALEASSGEDALAILKTNAANIDVVLLDVMMPGLSGFDVLRAIQNDPAMAKVKVIMMTAVSRVEDKVRALSAGASDYLVKPTDQQEIIARINVQLRLKRAEEELERYQQELEQLVEERTRDLEQANELLRREIESHKQAQEEIQAQNEEIMVHSLELEAANEELREAQRKLIETNERLEESERKLRTIFDNVNDEIIYLDESGTIIEINRRVQDIFGFDPEEIVGKRFDEFPFVKPEDMEEILDAFAKAIRDEKPTLLSFQAQTKTGEPVFVEASTQLIERDNNTTGIVVVVRDITERAESEQIIRKQAHDLGERLKQLHCVYGISKLTEKPGITTEELIQSTIRLIPYAMQYPEITAAQVRLGNQQYKTEEFEETPWKLGSPILVNGKPVGSLEVFYLEARPARGMGPFDIEERELLDALAEHLSRFIEHRQAEEELERREQEYSTLIELSPDGILLLSEGTIMFVNQRATELLGFQQDLLIGKNLLNFVHTLETDIMKELPESQKQQLLNDIVRASIDSSQTSTYELPLSKAPGSTLWIEANTSPIEYRGKPAQLVFIRDITERKRIEQMKTDLVSLVSHQLRTPVGMIRTYIENLLSGLTGDLTPMQREYLEEMRSICAKHFRLISDLLNVSRIERGVISCEIEPIDLMEVVDSAVREYRETIDRRGLELKLQFPQDIVIVQADGDKLIEAICNVINNSIKFTEKGSITIRIDKNERFGIVEVTDTGKGMSEDTLGKLFTKNLVPSETSTFENGSGLGLYIAKEFMKLQNGDITASSTPGKGSTFTFTIPLV